MRQHGTRQVLESYNWNLSGSRDRTHVPRLAGGFLSTMPWESCLIRYWELGTNGKKWESPVFSPPTGKFHVSWLIVTDKFEVDILFIHTCLTVSAQFPQEQLSVYTEELYFAGNMTQFWKHWGEHAGPQVQQQKCRWEGSLTWANGNLLTPFFYHHH